MLSLLQISTYKTDYIFDCFLIRELIRQQKDEPNTLTSIFNDPKIIKILHGSDTDLKMLMSDFYIATVNVFDTMRVFNYI